MRLNLGAGRKPILDGDWINIDLEPILEKGGRWLQSDVKKINLRDECAEEIQAIHLFEHFFEWEVDALLIEWRRLLKPEGRLVLELPDIAKAARNLLDGLPDQMCLWAFFGDPTKRNPLHCHKWGWTPQTLHTRLEQAGFQDVRFTTPKHHPKGRDNRDMRVECVK